MNFGERLQQLMARQHLTQAELARAMNVPQQSISRWVNSELPPRATTVDKIARALEVKPSQLLAFSSEPTPKAEATETVSLQKLAEDLIAATREEREHHETFLRHVLNTYERTMRSFDEAILLAQHKNGSQEDLTRLRNEFNMARGALSAFMATIKRERS